MVSDAVMEMTKLHHPAVFLSLDAFIEHGSFVRFEWLRDSGQHKVIDTFENLLAFTTTCDSIFISHQWLSFSAPDPGNLQFKAVCEACLELCRREAIPRSKLYVWLDFLSIPQSSRSLQQLAINTLPVYASMCTYFLVAAPSTQHESRELCDLASYSRRGWCRLEQWARLTAGREGMYVTTGRGLERYQLDISAALHVFSANFTNDGDKEKIKFIALGLWARILQITNGDAESQLHEMRQYIEGHRDEVFPPELFDDLPYRVEKYVKELAAGKGGMATEQESLFKQSTDTERRRCCKVTQLAIARQESSPRAKLKRAMAAASFLLAAQDSTETHATPTTAAPGAEDSGSQVTPSKDETTATRQVEAAVLLARRATDLPSTSSAAEDRARRVHVPVLCSTTNLSGVPSITRVHAKDALQVQRAALRRAEECLEI